MRKRRRSEMPWHALWTSSGGVANDLRGGRPPAEPWVAWVASSSDSECTRATQAANQKPRGVASARIGGAAIGNMRTSARGPLRTTDTMRETHHPGHTARLGHSRARLSAGAPCTWHLGAGDAAAGWIRSRCSRMRLFNTTHAHVQQSDISGTRTTLARRTQPVGHVSVDCRLLHFFVTRISVT